MAEKGKVTPAVKNKPQEDKRKGIPPQERVRNAVRSTGNKWAIENFNDTLKMDN